jgi:hypothetical protein
MYFLRRERRTASAGASRACGGRGAAGRATIRTRRRSRIFAAGGGGAPSASELRGVPASASLACRATTAVACTPVKPPRCFGKEGTEETAVSPPSVWIVRAPSQTGRPPCPGPTGGPGSTRHRIRRGQRVGDKCVSRSMVTRAHASRQTCRGAGRAWARVAIGRSWMIGVNFVTIVKCHRVTI